MFYLWLGMRETRLARIACPAFSPHAHPHVIHPHKGHGTRMSDDFVKLTEHFKSHQTNNVWAGGRAPYDTYF